MKLKREITDEIVDISLPEGGTAPLVLRQSKRAKRLSLRLMPGAENFELVIPAGCSERKALSFAQSRAGWIADRAEKLQDVVPFAIGETIPLRGTPSIIDRAEGLAEKIWVENERILVTIRPSMVEAGIKDWLREEARKRLTALATEKSDRIGKSVARVSLRDGKTRWGSCSPRGNLSFSWRIIMAPDVVSDYLVAHEVAHLAEMNHSVRFWRVADELSDDMETGKDWLRRHGSALHRYGAG